MQEKRKLEEPEKVPAKRKKVPSDNEQQSDDDPARSSSAGSADSDKASEQDTEFEVERILDDRCLRLGETEYFIKWKGYSASSNSWEPESGLKCTALLKEYRKNKEDENYKDEDEEEDSNSLSSEEQNPPKEEVKKSEYIGVRWNKARNNWRAERYIGGELLKTEEFETEKEAALASDRLILENMHLLKGMARLNFTDGKVKEKKIKPSPKKSESEESFKPKKKKKSKHKSKSHKKKKRKLEEPDATLKTVKQRLRALKSLVEEDLISKEVYDKRALQIVSEI